MNLPVDPATLSPDPLRALVAQPAVQLADREREVGETEQELRYRQPRSDQLTDELSIIKRQQVMDALHTWIAAAPGSRGFRIVAYPRG
ncbi:hypothetical protein LMG29542_07322 [Paraburkholderia humisilvae]|uniref:Uncharacterized protein n=1 Tax=Paraburkholderia humisilvae TaxID=627669 RepID=A0A6J5F463_9BURK|nr:hypothetical protein LMG29542_07322 [Paraburkholderia humisilvae]